MMIIIMESGVPKDVTGQNNVALVWTFFLTERVPVPDFERLSLNSVVGSFLRQSMQLNV